MWFVIMVLTFGSTVVLSRLVVSPVITKLLDINQKRSEVMVGKLDKMFIKTNVNRLAILFVAGPVLLGGAVALCFPGGLRLVGLLVGVTLGFVAPSIIVKAIAGQRKNKFEEQLIDALMMLSSSLKGGLSLLQSIEVVVEEMPDPVNQEFATVLGENKMGISFEEAFNHLYDRMPLTPVHQMNTAILLARETGGNLPVIFARIVATIRENRKIKQNLETLTLQGKIQGVVMSLLPVGFGFIVTATNKNFFDVMVNSNVGRGLLAYAVVSEFIGAYLIWKISSFKDF